MLNFIKKNSVALIFLFAAFCISLFYVAWNEPTFPDDLSLIPMKMIDQANLVNDRAKQIQRFDSVLNVIDEMLKSKPKNSTLLFYLGFANTSKGDYKKSISIHSENLGTIDSIHHKKLHENTKIELARNYYLLGMSFMREKNESEGFKSLYESFRYVPYYYPAIANIAQMMIDRNQLDSARQLLTAAIPFNPEKVVLYNEMGLIYYKENNFNESKNYFSRSLAIDPNNQDAKKFLSMINTQSN